MTPLQRGGLDAEHDQERWVCDAEQCARVAGPAAISQGRSEREPRNDERVSAGSRRCPSEFLAYEGGNAAWNDTAALRAVHPRRPGRFLVLAGESRVVGVTPCRAHERGGGPGCQHQHDGEDSCSEHVMLAMNGGKGGASSQLPRRPQTPTFSSVETFQRLVAGGIFRSECQEFRTR